MSWFQRVFDRLVEHEYHWASALFHLIFRGAAVLLGLVVIFYGAYRMKGMLSTIPPVIQFACVALVVLAALMLNSMFRERGRALAAYDRFLRIFEDVQPVTLKERANGLPEEKIAAIRARAGLLSGKPKEWWRALDASLELYTSPSGDEGWFLTTPVAEILPEEDVIDFFYHSEFHQSVPGILTSLGLLATFVAILMALAGVTYNVRDPMRPVSGIDQLINGLSGKFLSSIIALILSVIFTFAEKKLCARQLTGGYDGLVRRSKEVLPFLSQSRILLDIQRLAVRQTAPAAELR